MVVLFGSALLAHIRDIGAKMKPSFIDLETGSDSDKSSTLSCQPLHSPGDSKLDPDDDDVRSSLMKALEEVVQTGRFYCEGELRTTAPTFRLLSSGRIVECPLSEEGAQTIIEECHDVLSGSETGRLDHMSMHATWALDAPELAVLDLGWYETLDAICREIKQQFGWDGEIRAEFSQMVMYEKGAMSGIYERYATQAYISVVG